MATLFTPRIEKYLTRIGPRAGAVLLVTLLLWASIVAAAALYGLGMGIYGIWLVTWAAIDADPLDVALAVAVWVFVGLTAYLIRAAVALWRQYDEERWRSEQALSRLEKSLDSRVWKADDERGHRERLAERALESMEATVLGTPQPADLTVEERLLELDRRVSGEG